MTPTLTKLSDLDLMLNLWVSLVIAVNEMEIDPDAMVLSICRASDNDDTPDEQTTLAAILTEAERRLGVESHEISRETVAMQ